MRLRETGLDSPEVERLIASWNEELAAAIPGHRPGERSRVAAAEFVPPGGVFLVATSDGAALGCGGVRRLGPTTGEVKRLFVARAARGRGVGRILLDALEQRARALGFDALRLDTAAGHDAAIALFQASGYAPIERYNDNPMARHWFEKGL